MDGEQALREHFEATNRRDFATAMTYYDEHVVLMADPNSPSAGAYYGKEAVGRQMGDWMRTFAGGVVFDRMTFDRGRDAYAVTGRMTARGRESGVELQQVWAWLYWMRSGKIVRMEIHADPESVRAIAGVERS